MTFNQLLQYIRDKAKHLREKGDLFERAIKNFLKKSPEHNFENVWMWSDWPDHKKYDIQKQDMGIDLVAKEKETGNYIAIQCKCFNEDTQITKKHIDSFLAHSGKKPFTSRLIVTTTDQWNQDAIKATKNLDKRCKILTSSDLEELEFDWTLKGDVQQKEKLTPKDHQEDALRKAKEHFQNHNRGKLIMACGTGKTLTSLHIAEKVTSKNGIILFLAPSISLVSQALRVYAYQRQHTQNYLVVCSDNKAGKDSDGVDVDDLQISPTTDAFKIAKMLRKTSNTRTVVFSTYQSLDKIKEAQSKGSPKFDLVICDEAHRTTGIEATSKENGKTQGNFFTLINKDDYIKAYKRLYMTATPRIYSDTAQTKAQKDQVELCSMDDESIYGKEFYRLDFSKAIERKLLSDYKVIILTIDQKYISDHIQGSLKDTVLNDASKLVGCYRALKDQGEGAKGVMLKKAVAFLNTIKDSKECAKCFSQVVDSLKENQNDGFTCRTKHIDGTDNTIERNKKLEWLKEDAGQTEAQEHICRILFNSKCLTEGIDVPSLDAILFLQPRKSQVDVVQAVGRAMRKSKDKKYGYVILPVVIPAGSDAVKALDNNETYKVVWQVLNALRSHDDKFNAMINDINLNKKAPEKINIVGVGSPSDGISDVDKESITQATSTQLSLLPSGHEKIYAKIVEKCGDRLYQDKWIAKVKTFYETITTRINSLLEKDIKVKTEFTKYHKSLKSIIHAEISQEDSVSMLAEHLLTKRAFDKIFEGYEFSKNNPISVAMDKTIRRLQGYAIENEIKELETFYNAISKRVEGIDNSAGRQKIIKELYEDFIKTAFPKTAEKLGIAYTPIEIVDFILKSADILLKQEFNGRGLTSEGVHIIDAFAGTGIFINRLINNKNLILDKDLARKFEKELHANEILLLPYYVASINIEEAYHNRISGNYQPFPGIVLTDTFNLVSGLTQGHFEDHFKQNKDRIERQKQAPIQVIVGNPPYSGGQQSENDGNKNTSHPELEERIKETYVKESNVQNKNALYDSYIKAIRWASDRIEKQGIIGFVHNGSLIDGRATIGLRKCLVKEFDAIYCFNLRGHIKKFDKKEGENIFGQKSMCSIAITFLIKHNQVEQKQKKDAVIKYYDIGDYLKREQKLKIIDDFTSIQKINWQNITPGPYGDWIHQRDPSFDSFLPLGDKKSKESIFTLHSRGVCTCRDNWAYNFSTKKVKDNMQRMIDFYNQELERLKDQKITKKNFDAIANLDKEKVKWCNRLTQDFIRQKRGAFDKEQIRPSSYRPFTKSYLYFDKMFNNAIYQNPKIFPEPTTENKIICVSGVGANNFSVLITDQISSVDYINKTQCFPLYYYDISDQKATKRDSITDFALQQFQKHYKDQSIIKEDIFYYIYGLLHSKDYQQRYKNNLTKELPRIPFVPQFKDFSKIGQQLANLHLNYEDQRQNPKVHIKKDNQTVLLSSLKTEDLKVKKMKPNKKDQSKIIFNDSITIENIPQEAWNYEINGQSAIKYVTDRYQVKTDKDSQITNNPNDYSEDPAYILKLLLSVITVSLKTQKLIDTLPAINFDKLAQAS